MRPGAVPAIPTLEIGGRVFTDLTNLITLTAYTASNTRSSFFRAIGAASYQVPVSKKFKILASRTWINTATAAIYNGSLAYADNDVGLDSSTAFTNAVYEMGAAGGLRSQQTSTGVQAKREDAHDFEVPAAKYPSFAGSANVGCQIFGYEVAV